jgi:ribosomal protein L21
MTYAIIEFAGYQFKVKPEDSIIVTGEFGKPQTQVEAKMLLLNQGEVEIGTPELKTPVKLEVVSVSKGTKIRVATYRAKSKRRRVVGHRQFETTFKVLNWMDEPEKTVKTPAKAKAKAKTE